MDEITTPEKEVNYEKKLYHLAMIRTVLMCVLTVAILGSLVFAYQQMTVVMDAVNSITEMTESMEETLDTIDVDQLNSTLDDMSTITSNLKDTSEALSDFNSSLSGFFGFGK